MHNAIYDRFELGKSRGIFIGIGVNAQFARPRKTAKRTLPIKIQSSRIRLCIHRSSHHSIIESDSHYETDLWKHNLALSDHLLWRMCGVALSRARRKAGGKNESTIAQIDSNFFLAALGVARHFKKLKSDTDTWDHIWIYHSVFRQSFWHGLRLQLMDRLVLSIGTFSWDISSRLMGEKRDIRHDKHFMRN